ncbi:hypothetical protein BQ8482_250116 [Mesorhizobium delmotii]|uniref:Uncharacterized protein n=1 Tax=Mesorhizobium delmotii TaxID=1631247 RepID=A0A2P9AM68_9HYPH|nr:hypothetical protein BQ8482_250116 [Mesorhizobium delmotii]
MRSPHRGILSWSFTTLAVAAKTLMSSVPDYLMIETAFTAVQWIIVGPLTALAFDYGNVEAKSDSIRAMNRSPASHYGTARLWKLDGALTTRLHHQSPPQL